MRSHLWIQTLSRLLVITSAEPSQNRTRTAKSRDLLIKILTPSTYMVATCIPLASILLCLCLRTTAISLAFHLLCLYLVAKARPLPSQLPYLCLVTTGMPLASELLCLQPYGWRCNMVGLLSAFSKAWSLPHHSRWRFNSFQLDLKSFLLALTIGNWRPLNLQFSINPPNNTKPHQ